MSAATESRQTGRAATATASRTRCSRPPAPSTWRRACRPDRRGAEPGAGRATIYRWFGSRERLLSEVIADELEALIRKRREVRRRGGHGLLEVFDRINRACRAPPRCAGSSSRSAPGRCGCSPPAPAWSRRGPSRCITELIRPRWPPAATSRPPSRRRWPTPSSAWARRFSTTTPRSGSGAITRGCARSRRRCSGFPTPGAPPKRRRRATRTAAHALRLARGAAGGGVRRRPKIARSPPWIPLGHTIMAAISTTP